MPRRDNGPSEKKAARTLILDPPQAGPGLDTRRMLYTRTGYRIDHFANHEWVDTPAHMLGPLAVQALRESTTWGAVVPAPGAVRGDMRLSLQILQLQHNFQHQPSQIEFTLRAYLSDATTRRVIAWRDIAARAPAPSETPHGGVLAANAAVHQALLELVAFVTASVP
jgi:cholesterol transport system auxiliary component